MVEKEPITGNQEDLQETEFESIRSSMNSDQPAKEDYLGFKPYVEAVACFLTDSDTTPPLTLSIEGKWGSGKSSFMKQLEKMLKDDKNLLTVHFNAWRHDKEDSLWAALVLDFMRQVPPRLSLWKRIKCCIKLYLQRFSWKTGKFDLLRGSAIWFSFLFLALIIFFLYFYKGFNWINSFSDEFLVGNSDLSKQALSWFIGFGGGAGLLGIIFSAMMKLKSVAGSPFDFNFNRYFKSPDYESHVAFIESFHEDFQKIVDAYANECGGQIYIFIDDIDRCEVPKASDLMQAINLIISDDPHLIFIIGMDRDKVAASVAVKGESLLPYLYSEKSTSEDSTQDSGKTNSNTTYDDKDMKPECVNGLRFGYEFIEKFIQVPFTVPVPTSIDLVDFLDKVSRPAPKTRGTKAKFKKFFEKMERFIPFKKLQPNPITPGDHLGEPPTVTPDNEIKNEKVLREKVRLVYDKDSKRVQDITSMAAPALDYNPRRIKQFVNLFRLRIYIAKNTGLFDYPIDPSGKEELTLEQVGKFVAINIKWPLLVKDLETDPLLLSKLQEEAINPGSKKVKQWGSDVKLMTLIGSNYEKKNYNLSALDVSRLLSVSRQAIFQGDPEVFQGIKFVKIKKGSFLMGSEDDEKEEGPVHEVEIQKPFYLSIFPITQQQWKSCMGENPSHFIGEDYPVEQVSWDDVQRFIKKLNEKEGSDKYRLPTEAEWEYAARAGTKEKYFFGNEKSKLHEYAWYSFNSGETHPVRKRKPNQWGLYDMYGNVWEWVQDKWHSNYIDAPRDGSAWESGKSSDRVARGGCWGSYAKVCRSSSREYYYSGIRYHYLGFRLVRIL